MPRKSVAELSVAPDPVELDRRLPAPSELTSVEAQIWHSVVATKPADWFQADCAPVLVAYCKHISAAMQLDEWALQTEDPEQYLKLLDARRKETGKIESCATKLRLTPQSRYNAQSANTADKAASGHKPWERKSKLEKT